MMCNSLRSVLLATVLASFSAMTQPGLAAPAGVLGRDNNTALMTSFPSSQAKFNQFTSMLTSFGVDGIETAAGFDPALTFGSTGITAATQGVLAQSAPTFQIDDQALVEVDAIGFPQVNTMFTFNQYITAFGIFVIQGGDTTNNNPTTFRLWDTTANTSVDKTVQVGPGWGDNNVLFLGVIDSVPFDRVEIIETGDALDGMLYDNVVAGFIPEPGSLALLMIGGAGARCRTRRFRRG